MYPAFTYPFPQIVEDLDLHQSLVVEPLFIADDLDGHGLARTVIAAVQHLSKRTLPERVNDLVPIRKVVMRDHQVVATLVVIAMVIVRILHGSRLLLAPGAEEVYRWIFKNLLALIVRKILDLAALEDGCRRS